jgi:hypothetical protein
MGDFTDHLAVLKAKADTFARRLRSPRLTETDVVTFHRSIYIPSMRYGLAALATNEEELSKVQSQISRAILQRLHIRSTIPTALRYGPLELGGLGLYDLRTEMGVETLKFLRNALYSDSEAGNLIRLNIDYLQREAGVDFHLLEQPNRHVSYLTPSWILSVRQFLGNNNMHLQISDLHLDPLRGPLDEYIMQPEHLQRYTPSQQSDLNLVRLWLQVATLADMGDPDRSHCIRLCFLTVTVRLILSFRRRGLARPNPRRLNSVYGIALFAHPFFATLPIGKCHRHTVILLLRIQCCRNLSLMFTLITRLFHPGQSDVC